jgi:hypothetical protein
MTETIDPSSTPSMGFKIERTFGLDGVDTCLRRLLSLHTRIESNWPESGHFLVRGRALTPETQALIADLLTSLPTPLPLVPGKEPERLIGPDDTNLLAVAARAVDAGLALLDGATLDKPYPREVRMLETRQCEAAGPITVSDATVGLLVATIIGTLEAISELIMEPAKVKASPPRPAKQEKPPKPGSQFTQPKRGPSVPRI